MLLPPRVRLLSALGPIALVTGIAGGSVGQPARRGVPRTLRGALVGCLALPRGEVQVIERHGATGLRSRWRATGRSGRVETHSGSMLYRPDLDAVEGGCGGRSQHGQFCLFSLDASGAVTVNMISRYSGRATRLEVSACAPGTDVTVAARPPPVPIPADAPAADLIGQRRRRIDAGRTPSAEEAGWTRYGDDLAILYEAGLAIRVRLRVGALSCEDAAHAAGFAPRPGSTPLRRRGGCEWPGRSARHRLAPRVAASYADGVFEVRVRP